MATTFNPDQFGGDPGAIYQGWLAAGRPTTDAMGRALDVRGSVWKAPQTSGPTQSGHMAWTPNPNRPDTAFGTPSAPMPPGGTAVSGAGGPAMSGPFHSRPGANPWDMLPVAEAGMTKPAVAQNAMLPGGAGTYLGGALGAPGGGAQLPTGGSPVSRQPGTPTMSGPFQSGPMPQIGQPGAPFAGPQGSNENRGTNVSGLDPRLDSLYQFALQQALTQFGNPNGMQFYGGPTVAGLTPDELRAQELLRGQVGGLQGISGGAQDLFSQLVANAQNPGADPTLNAAISGAMGDMRDQALGPGGIFSQIRNSSVANGSVGSSRQGVMEGLAASDLATRMGRLASDMRLTGRQQNIQNAQTAVGQIPTLIGAATAPGSILGGVGAQNRDMEQRTMDDALRRWAYNIFEPDRRLDALFGRIGSAPLGGWSSTSTTMGEDFLPGANGGTSNAQNILGGVAGAASLIDILRRSGLFGG